MTLATLLLPLAFVLPSMLRPSPVPAHTSSAVSMCAWDSRDEAALHRAIQESTSAAKLGDAQYALSGLDAAWVLIFNAGKADEGVYTLQGAAPRANAYVLTFEAVEDAERFAQLLQAEAFDLATPLRWGVDQLHEFCEVGQFAVSMVPTGCLITPPTKNEFDVDAFERIHGGSGDGTRDGLDEVSLPDSKEARTVESGPDAFGGVRASLERSFGDEDSCGDDDCLLE